MVAAGVQDNGVLALVIHLDQGLPGSLVINLDESCLDTVAIQQVDEEYPILTDFPSVIDFKTRFRNRRRLIGSLPSSAFHQCGAGDGLAFHYDMGN